MSPSGYVYRTDKRVNEERMFSRSGALERAFSAAEILVVWLVVWSDVRRPDLTGTERSLAKSWAYQTITVYVSCIWL